MEHIGPTLLTVMLRIEQLAEYPVVSDSNEEYRRYMASEEWRAKRQEAFDYYGRECMRCGETRRLEVHHRTYARFGRELVYDLEVLCGNCHVDADIQRRQAAQNTALTP